MRSAGESADSARPWWSMAASSSCFLRRSRTISEAEFFLFFCFLRWLCEFFFFFFAVQSEESLQFTLSILNSSVAPFSPPQPPNRSTPTTTKNTPPKRCLLPSAARPCAPRPSPAPTGPPLAPPPPSSPLRLALRRRRPPPPSTSAPTGPPTGRWRRSRTSGSTLTRSCSR